MDALALTLREARAQDVPVALWPMLADREGRWASALNGETFARSVRRTLAELDARGCAPRALIVDIEPPIDAMKRWLRWATGGRDNRAMDTGSVRTIDALDPGRTDAGTLALDALREELRGRGVRVGAAVVPTGLVGAGAGRWLERWLGLSVSDRAYEPASVMLYTSMLEGYSRGWISRPRALSLLSLGARRARERFGPDVEVSLGLVGTGALESEPIYRDPGELSADVSAARAAGVHRLALFDLRGVLARGSPERWLDALTEG